MIPVELQPEPEDFDIKIRQLGKRFLEENQQPSSEQWNKRPYWQKALPDMRKAYKSVCAYCATWIPHATGNHSIDHFVPKSRQPSLAYEWKNFRYVSARFNSRKGIKEILDPFELKEDFFFINFNSFFISPNSTLSSEELKLADETIKCLKLNLDDDLVRERQAWFIAYRDNEISFAHLEQRSPFIAYEIARQGLKRLSKDSTSL
jgi:hypothetical protein